VQVPLYPIQFLFRFTPLHPIDEVGVIGHAFGYGHRHIQLILNLAADFAKNGWQFSLQQTLVGHMGHVVVGKDNNEGKGKNHNESSEHKNGLSKRQFSKHEWALELKYVPE